MVVARGANQSTIFSFIDRFTSNSFESGLGFQLQYESIEGSPQMAYRIGACGGNVTTPNGLLTSPSYPEHYPRSAQCTYSISLTADTFLSFTILSLDIKYDWGAMFDNIDQDYFEIRDGASKGSPLIYKCEGCGTESPLPMQIQSTQNNVWMR